MTITILITDRYCTPIGDPISGWTGLTATPTHNAVGSGTLTVPATPDVLEQLDTTRARLVIYRDGQYFFGGPIEQNGYAWSQDPAGGGSGDESSPGLVTLSFADDLAWVTNELAYPDPGSASTAQLDAFYTATAVNAETIMHNLVNLNIGPGAITARQVPQLVLASPAGVGTSVNLSTRFEPLADVLRRVALAGGNIGFRTVQDANRNIVFTTYSIADLSTQILFSRGLSNLRRISYAPAAPTCTVAIVGGDGTGTDRTIRERTNDPAIDRYGRIAQFVNQSGETDTTVMDQAGDAALASGAESAQVSFSALDTDDQKYGVDYALGDMVTLEVWPGLQIQQQVRAVTLTADPSTGEVVTPLIGSDAAITDTKTLDVLRFLETRIGYLERS